MTAQAVTSNENASNVVTKVMESLGGKPLFSEAANKALQLVRQPDCSVKGFTEIVNWDPHLAARVLGIANSCLYSPRRPIESLERAVALLGFQECQNIIVATCVSRLMQHRALHDAKEKTLLCHHSYMTSLMSRYLSRSLGLVFQGEDFTAGLLHDIGRILLLITDIELFHQAECQRFDLEEDCCARETQMFGADHCEIGGQLCDSLGLPPRLGDVVRFHHSPADSQFDERLVRLVAAADHAANHLQQGLSTDDYRLEANPWLFSIDAALSDEFWNNLQAGFSEALTRVEEETQQMTALFG